MINDEAKCDYNCFCCKYDDCLNDKITITEIIDQFDRDRNYIKYGKVIPTHNHQRTKLKHNRI